MYTLRTDWHHDNNLISRFTAMQMKAIQMGFIPFTAACIQRQEVDSTVILSST